MKPYSEIENFANELYEKGNYAESKFNEFKNTFLDLLNKGEIRAAERSAQGEWLTNIWVKKGILLLFKYGKLKDYSINKNFPFFDKDTIALKPLSLENAVRLVPGGSSIRTGAYVAKSVICMPPMYINIGAYVDEGTMIDSNALVGTAAQIGKRVHISAAAQIGGVLEPPGANPVIIEDDVLIGGNCGVYEGVIVREKAVLGSGTIITASTPIYDLINGRIIKKEKDKPIEIPKQAVLVPGSRAIKGDFASEHNLSVYCPIIIKYRDDKTDAKAALEELLR